MKNLERPCGIPAIFHNSICTNILAILIKTESLRLGLRSYAFFTSGKKVTGDW